VPALSTVARLGRQLIARGYEALPMNGSVLNSSVVVRPRERHDRQGL